VIDRGRSHGTKECPFRKNSILDHLFRLGVNVMYHEAMYLVVQHILKTYGSAGQILPPDMSFYVIEMSSPLHGIIM
jgi:hypothetical protein